MVEDCIFDLSFPRRTRKRFRALLTEGAAERLELSRA
jgi:hypothetical protein